MTSEDENDYHQHLQVHKHTAINSLSSASSCTSISQQQQIQQQQQTNIINNRRRSSYGQNHFPQTLSSQTINFKDIIDRNNICSNAIITNGQSNDTICTQLTNNNNNYNSSLSPNRYMTNGEYSLGNRLPTVSQERYDENVTCCLPPPSPAPNNDRFIMGIPSSSSLHYQDNRLAVHHRTMSPSSK